MPVDLTKPADHSPVVAAELRAQFSAIADDIDGTALNPGGSVFMSSHLRTILDTSERKP
jgi:hypothetical protein